MASSLSTQSIKKIGLIANMADTNKYNRENAVVGKEYLPLSKAVRQVTGTSPHISTLLRWCTNGARGRTLGHVIIGGRKMTTVEDVRAFIQVVEAKTPSHDHLDIPKDRTRAIEKAVHDLRKIVGN